MKLRQKLEGLQLSVSFSPGDGHCLFHSFLSSWNSQISSHAPLSLSDIIQDCQNEVRRNITAYKPFVDESEADILTQLNNYLVRKNFDQSIGDVVPQVLANTYAINICIFDVIEGDQFNSISILARENSHADTLFLHRINDNHYNGLVQIPVPTASVRITYSRDQLITLNCNPKIQRSTRKALFAHKLWKQQRATNPMLGWTTVSRTRRKHNENRVNAKPTNKASSVNTTFAEPAPQADIPVLNKYAPLYLNSTSEKATSCEDGIKIGLLNPCSACNKPLLIRDYITSNQLDILALTETFQLTDSVISQLLPDGYDILYNLRDNGKKGGGVALIHKEIYRCSILEKYNRPSLDAILIKLKVESKVMHIGVMYAPECKNNQPSSTRFIEDFSTILYDDIAPLNNILLLGDFNYHVNKKDDPYAKSFLGLLDSCGFQQHVHFPTHIKGNTLDLVISRGGEIDPSNLSTDGSVSPDHFGINFNISLIKPTPVIKSTTSRNWKAFSLDDFLCELRNANLNDIQATTDVSDAINTYNNVLDMVINNHAPKTIRKIKRKHLAPWYNESIRDAKRMRRQYERRWRKSKLFSHWEDYRTACNNVNHELQKARQMHYHSRLNDSKSQKETFQIGNSLLFGKTNKILPNYDSAEALAERFAHYFSDKIKSIRDGLPGATVHKPPALGAFSNQSSQSLLCDFEPASEAEISKLIRKCAPKSCDLDPIPTWLLKLCLSELLPVITHIVNLSLSTSTVAPEMKLALVTPLIKKALLDPEILKNFRPVSNLSFISKLIERVVVKRFSDHLASNGLNEIYQSAYKALHSTETALLKVQNDLLMSLDTMGGAVLVLLDLSAAFDTIDHSILINRLYDLGVRGSALDWFKSYLGDRKQTILIDGSRSTETNLNFGVPQGSVLGPILFTIYTRPLGNIAKKFGLQYHLYADDTQLYVSFKPSDTQSVQSTIAKIEQCYIEIKQWMDNNMLKLNGDKTECLVVTNKKHSGAIKSLNFDGFSILSQPSVRNLGVIFNSIMDVENFINAKCKAASYCLRNISKVRRSLTHDAAKTLVQAYVLTKLDYCNSLLCGSPKLHQDRLQKILHYAARVVNMVPKRQSIRTVLADLHWLPIKQRIDFKILMYVYKALNGLAPVYLADSLVRYTPVRDLRSRTMDLLHAPQFRLDAYGGRAFANAAPRLWNKLPYGVKQASSIENFKTALKTHLYKQAYVK